MVALTFALVYYSRVAIVEGNKGRKKDSIEKQLEKLQSPMFEILDRAKPYEEELLSHEDLQLGLAQRFAVGKYHYVSIEDHRILWRNLTNYSHYLDKKEHDELRRLLESGDKLISGGERFYPDANYTECLGSVSKRRTQLTSELRELTSM